MANDASNDLKEHIEALLPALFELCGWNRSFSLKRLRTMLNENHGVQVTSADNARLADLLARRDDVFPVVRDGTRWQFGKSTRPISKQHLIRDD
jgi:hypothetical protein